LRIIGNNLAGLGGTEDGVMEQYAQALYVLTGARDSFLLRSRV
jgi:hypothetical protein